MSFLGRYQLGEIVPLPLTTVNASDTPSAPAAVPTCQVYRGVTPVAGFTLPAVDNANLPGFFLYPLFLEAKFSAGNYRVVFHWAISSTTFTTLACFDVLSSGDAEGGGIALGTLRMPGMNFALMQTRSGRIGKYRNPRTV